jgi:hypothetical protein
MQVWWAIRQPEKATGGAELGADRALERRPAEETSDHPACVGTLNNATFTSLNDFLDFVITDIKVAAGKQERGSLRCRAHHAALPLKTWPTPRGHERTECRPRARNPAHRGR